MGFSRQEYWSGLPFPWGDLPNPGIELWSPALQADALPSEPPGKMGRYESGTSTEGSAQVHACMQPCTSSLIHQYWLNSSLCAGYTRLWNTMEAKPEFLLSWCLCTSGRDGHWSSNCTHCGNIVTMRGPIKEEHRTLGEKITERLAQSEKFPWTNDLTDVSIEWWDINWVKKGEKSTLGRWVRIQAGGRFEDWKKAKCGQDKDSPGKWAAWHWKAAKDQPGSLGPVDHVMVSVFILRTKGNQQESLGNSESGKRNTFILYFQFSHHSTDYQPMC